MSGVEFLPPETTTSAVALSTSNGSSGSVDFEPPSDAVVAEKRPARPRERWRRRLSSRSLTARLVTGVVLLVAMLVAVVATTTYYSLSSFLFGQLDQQVTPVANANARNIVQACAYFSTSSCTLGGNPGYRVASDEWITALGSSGAAVATVVPSAATEGLHQLELTSAQAAAVVRRPSVILTLTTSDGIELRAGVRTVPTASGNYYVVSGLATSGVRNTLRHQFLAELLIGLAAILLAALATWSGVQFSLRHLRRVTTTAQDVAAELSPTGSGLDRRVDVRDDGSEVGQLAESMNTLLSAVETQFAARLQSETRLRQFLADASHELRTPLTSIRGYAELARMQRAAGADAEDNLSRIESEGTRMSRLVEDLLTLARGEQGGEVPAQQLIDIGELVDDVVHDTRAAFPNRQVDANPAPGLQVIGDRDQLLRAVRNLTANAAVHTAANRPILVRCLPDGNDAVIQVIDGGPGLAPDDAAHVFERFWRADKARSRARGGTGLGLSIVASIVAAHGGTVRFDSTVEGGSTVTLRLPAVVS